MYHKLILKSITSLVKILPINTVLFFNNELNLVIEPKFLINTLIFLKYHVLSQFKVLTLISAVDYLHKKDRFELNYELLSIRFNNRIRIKTKLNEVLGINSCEFVYSSANWYECEIWDMFGIFFFKHSNLKRILTDYGFEGNPLRKDFPLSGYVELKYNDIYKRIVNEPLELAQEYRTFNFLNPWL
jgi:NADH dehydrogenase (ubiquinone) Fe-S protein 3